MSNNRFRINVKFGDTKLLVPCGKGDLTVDELIEKAVERFKRNKKMHEDDNIVVEDIFQADGSACDRNDQVQDLLDDKETVTLIYKIIPHDAPPDFEPVLVGTEDSAPSASSATPSQSENKQNSVLPAEDATPVLNNSGTQAAANRYCTASPAASTAYSSGGGGDGRYSSPVPQYNPGLYSATHEFRSTPPFGSHENLLNGATVDTGEVHNGTADYRPSDSGRRLSRSSELLDEGERLSQVVMETMVGEDFSQELSSHPHSQMGHSQISLHSDLDGQQKYVSANSADYEMEMMPTSNHHQRTPPTSSLLMQHQSSSQHGLDSISKSGVSALEHRHAAGLSFTTSQSMEQLDLHQQYQHKPMHQDGYLYNKGPGLYPGPPLALSQDYSMAHSQQDLYYYGHGDSSGAGGYIMTQPESYSRHIYAAQRYRSPYPQQQRGQYPPPPVGMGGRDHPSDYYHGYPLPPQMSASGGVPPGFGEYVERRKRTSGGDYDVDHMAMAGRGARHAHPMTRSWAGGKNFEEDYLQRSFIQREDDPSIDYHLSQPAPYSGMGRYPPHHLTPPVHMGRGMGGAMYSLSQPGGTGLPPSYKRQKKSVLKNRNEQSPRSDIRSGHLLEEPSHNPSFSIDEELSEGDEEFDESKPSPFQRSASKSMILDNRWGRWEEIMENMNLKDEYECQVPEYNEDDKVTKKQLNSSGKEGNGDTEDEKEEADDLGNLHIVELLRGDEPLGIRLVSYTAEGRDLGVFIRALDKDGFAAKSGKLKTSDRILACNGEDFTDESNQRVEERFREMAIKEPLLRIAISRGFMLDLKQSEDNHSTSQHSPTASSGATGSDNHPSGETGSPPTTSNTMSNVFTNTRQIGVKHNIEIARSARGTFGFGLSSRDVATNDEDHPIYIKSIASDGPAFHDGRLKLGDRLLEVNDISVKGLSQSEVVNLLRGSHNTVKLLVSRQEMVEAQDEFTETSEPTPLVSSVGKTVMVFDIHLSNGLAGLGVTVHGRCNSRKQHSGDMGIYIKSIVPGGAAARDGRLKVHDQLLSVNGQSVTNMSNRDAMESLKKALNQEEPNKVSNIQITIARTGGVTNRKHNLGMTSFSSQMPALKEEERLAPDGGQAERANEIGIDCPRDMKLSPVLSQELDLGEHFDPQPIHDDLMLSRSSTGSQSSVGRLESSIELYGRQQYRPNGAESLLRTAEYIDSSPQTSRQRDSMSYSPRPNEYYGGYSESSLDWSNRQQSKNWVRQSDHVTSSLSFNKRNHSPMRQESLSPTSERSMWLSASNDHSKASSSPGFSYPRSASVHSELSSHSQPISYRSHHMSHHTLPFSPPDQSSYHSSSMSLQGGSRGSFRRKASPPYDTLEGSPVAARARSKSKEIVASTLPRMTSSGKYVINESDPTCNEDEISLVSHSSDPELNPFQRDHIARKSIPKNKNVPQPNLSHVQLANVVPKMEGEGSPSPPLFRTGSDTDIANALSHMQYPDMMQEIEVGPNLRLAKSTSLESLQTVMHYTINADGAGPLRSRGSARNSFRRAVDRSYAQDRQVNDKISSSTMISLTKNPKKKSARKSILQWIRPKKSKSKNKRRSRAMSTAEFDFSQDSIDNLAKEFGLSMDTIRRMQSHSGKIEGDDQIDRQEEEEEVDEAPENHFYSTHNSRAL